MDDICRIAGFIRTVGFQCIRCGTCCSAVEKDSDLVLVTPPEIHRIEAGSGLPWNDIAEPYPEFIEEQRGRFTLGWCLIRTNNHCRFLMHGSCSIYATRPWICRTYPFSLSGDAVQVSPCPGLGREICRDDALRIAQDLVARKKAETDDEAAICGILKDGRIPPDQLVVVDCEGIKIIRR